jgi:phosphoribosylamine--glycine ligase
VRVLVVGGGGREHALCWFLARSATVYCAPGNPGTAQVGTNLPLKITDHSALIDAARQHRIDLVVIGPEAPLAAGLADDLRARGIPAFGPSANAARIESSKAFSKDLMERAGVPTARSCTFTNRDGATRYIQSHSEPVVVKASGLAAGKGAVVCATRAEAVRVAGEMLDGKLGDAGREIVIEEFLRGEELSILALTDGEQVKLLPASQDHKRLLDHDEGPNTGGMGAYAPVSLATPALLRVVEQRILLPTLQQLAEEGSPYRGVIYAGLMIDPNGKPSVVEFNCRLGDPETQVVLPLVESNLLEDFAAIADGTSWKPGALRCRGAAVTTVLAARGYPDAPEKGMTVTIPRELPANTVLFHAGTATGPQGTLQVNGGRVFSATGMGSDFPAAQAASRALADAVRYEGKVYRQDIGWREMTRARAS